MYILYIYTVYMLCIYDKLLSHDHQQDRIISVSSVRQININRSSKPNKDANQVCFATTSVGFYQLLSLRGAC